MRGRAKPICASIAIIIAMCILAGCAGGSSYKVEHATQQNVKKGAEQAISAMDRYLNYAINEDELKDTMVEIQELVGDTYNYDYGTPEYIIAGAVYDLVWAKSYYDAFVSERRDIIAANTGTEITETVYQTVEINDRVAVLNFDYPTDGLSDLSTWDDDYFAPLTIFASFDVSHGYSPEGVMHFFEAVDNGISAPEYKIIGTIEYYRQPAAYVTLAVDGEGSKVMMYLSKATEADNSSQFAISDIERLLSNLRIVR